MTGSTVLVIIIILCILLSSGASNSGGKKRRADYSKTPHLWYGTTENGDCYIDIRKYIIYSPIEQCPKEWKNADAFTAVAAFIKPDSSIVYKRFKARLCEKDSLYYLTDTEYKRISRGSRLLGQVMPLPNYRRMISGQTKVSGKYDLAEESRFKLFGYNVGAKDDFSPEYRQKVLMFIIESGLYSKYEAISHLDFNISNHVHNPNNRLAISKWEADRLFLSNYSFEGANVNWVTNSNPPDVETASPIKTSQSQRPTDKPQKKPSSVVNIKEEALKVSSKPVVYQVGDTVNHRALGNGVVVSVDVTTNLIHIDFDGQVKRFSLKTIGEYLL